MVNVFKGQLPLTPTILLLCCGFSFAGPAPSAHFDYLQGLVEERAGNTAKALEAYKRVVDQDPQALEVLRDIATLQMRLGHADEALQAADKAKSLAPKDPASFIFLGNVHVAQGNFAKAAEAYEEALKLDPENLNALENLGNYYALVDPEKSLVYYQRYLDKNPRAGDMLLQMGLVSQRLGKLDKALAYFDKALALDDRQSAPWLAKAEVYEQQFSTAAATQAYEKAMTLQPSNPMIQLRLGHVYYRQGRWADAENQFLQVRQAVPQDPTVLYWLARVKEEQKEWAKAASYAEDAYALTQDPQFLPLAAYYFTLDHSLKKAVAWLERSKRADPKNSNTYLFLGMNYLELGQTEDAQKVLLQGVDLAPSDPQLHFHLGVAEDKLGRPAEAEAQFRKVLSLDPSHSAAMNYMGYTWADKNVRLEEAEKLLREANRLDPKNPAYLDSLGWVLFKQGKFEESITLLEKAAAQYSDPLILDHLGDVSLAHGNPDAAMRAWSQALALDPKNSSIEKKLNELSAFVTPGTDGRKLLKYIEGNFRQIQSLRSPVTVRMRWIGKPLKARGDFRYQRPDHIRLEVAAPDQSGMITFNLQGQTLEVTPPAWAQRFQALPVDSLSEIPRYFSGELLAGFDDPSTTIVAEKKNMRYARGPKRIVVDAARGVVTHYERPGASSGMDEIDISRYAFIDGLWLPVEMRLRNRDTGWEAGLTFTEWSINHPAQDK